MSAGIALVRVNDASALYEKLLSAGVVQLVALPRSELRAAGRVRRLGTSACADLVASADARPRTRAPAVMD